jgi:hypothetical protein
MIMALMLPRRANSVVGGAVASRVYVLPLANLTRPRKSTADIRNAKADQPWVLGGRNNSPDSPAPAAPRDCDHKKPSMAC